MNLVKSTGTFGFYTIISRLLGYLRDVLIAIFLGTSFLADVFFVAFRIPNTFRRLFAEGTFNAAFHQLSHHWTLVLREFLSLVFQIPHKFFLTFP